MTASEKRIMLHVSPECLAWAKPMSPRGLSPVLCVNPAPLCPLGPTPYSQSQATGGLGFTEEPNSDLKLLRLRL